MGLLFSRMFSSLLGNQEARILVLGLDNAGKTTILYRLQMGEVVSTIPTIGFNVETVQYNNIKFQVWDLGGQTSIRPYWRCYFPNTQAVIYVVDSSDTERIGIAKEEFHSILELIMFAHILPDIVIGLGCHFNFNVDVDLNGWGMENDNKQKAADLYEAVELRECNLWDSELLGLLVAINQEEELKGAVVLIFANKQDLPGALDDAAVTEALELHKIKSRQWAIFKACATKGEGLFEGLDW
ncbi:hypothetical protein DKX38_027701 [Salix brachista]|uniref:ADP-ribosylation factor 3 n=1 Tax=Salix brachista TaxID=2182728 RepID=A0A5N5J8I6_9ROSI|nr:hypothetical protein DKX38_027701 [Salix brachista]